MQRQDRAPSQRRAQMFSNPYSTPAADAIVPADSGGWPRPLTAWTTVVVLTIASTCSFIDRQILVLLIAPIQRDLQITDFEFSLLAGPAFTLLYVIMGVPLARAADMVSRRGVIAVGVALWSAMTAACGLASTFSHLFAARVGVAIGEAALTPAAYSMISDSFPAERRAKPTVTYAMGAYLGAGLAMIIGGAAIAAVMDAETVHLSFVGTVRPWQFAFMLVGVPGLVLTLVFAFIPEPRRRGVVHQAEGQKVVPYLRANWKAFFGVSMAFSIFLIVPTSFLIWVPAFLMRVHGLSAPATGAAYGMILLTFVWAGNYAGSWIVDRLRARGRASPVIDAAAIGMLGALPFTLLLPVVPDLGMVLGALALASFCFGIVNGMPALSLTAICSNRLRATIYSVYFVIASLIAAGAGPVLVASVSQFLLGGPSDIGVALAIVSLVTTPVAVGFFLWSRKAYEARLLSMGQDDA